MRFFMNKEKLIKKKISLKKQLRLPKNKNNHSERLKVLNKLNAIKIDLRWIESNERAGITEKNTNKSDGEFQEHIDQYRYYSILKRLNDQYRFAGNPLYGKLRIYQYPLYSGKRGT